MLLSESIMKLLSLNELSTLLVVGELETLISRFNFLNSLIVFHHLLNWSCLLFFNNFAILRLTSLTLDREILMHTQVIIDLKSLLFTFLSKIVLLSRGLYHFEVLLIQRFIKFLQLKL